MHAPMITNGMPNQENSQPDCWVAPSNQNIEKAKKKRPNTNVYHAFLKAYRDVSGFPDQITLSPGSISDGSIIMHRRLAPVLRALLLDVGEILVEHDAVLAGERDEALAAGAADEREVSLARELDAPGGEARARDQDRNAHAHGLDHHLRGQAAGGVEDLVVGGHLVLEHEARDLVDGVVAADVLHVEERLVLVRQHAAMDGAGFEIERRRGVDGVGERIEPGGAQLRLRQGHVL